MAVTAAAVIAFASLYLTHGFNTDTTVALAGTLGSLGLTLGLSWIFFGLADFTGLASEEGLTLPLIAGDIDLASLLLGGAIIGALGALDDVTVTQVATVSELRYRNPGLSRRELTASGIRVGREHIAATVNTLLLAYAGAGLPLLLLFAVSDQSLAMVANSELIAVEIVRTLVRLDGPGRRGAGHHRARGSGDLRRGPVPIRGVSRRAAGRTRMTSGTTSAPRPRMDSPHRRLGSLLLE